MRKIKIKTKEAKLVESLENENAELWYDSMLGGMEA